MVQTYLFELFLGSGLNALRVDRISQVTRDLTVVVGFEESVEASVVFVERGLVSRFCESPNGESTEFDSAGVVIRRVLESETCSEWLEEITTEAVDPVSNGLRLLPPSLS